MKICVKCVLPETFPGIRFNEEGVCNFCLEFKGKEYLEHQKHDYEKRFNALIKELKGKYTYDVLMCYSGGKDSTYTLMLLKQKYNLNILAVTYDNGFIPEQTFQNVRSVVEHLGVDHIFFKPKVDLLRNVFKVCSEKDIYSSKTLERASTICTSCMGIIKFNTLKLALDMSIPLIAFGWSPGQAPVASSVMKNNAQLLKITQKAILEPLHIVAGDEIKRYFLEERYFSGNYNFPYNVHLLAFLEYNEEKIYNEISKMGWIAPKETDANSTNCLLNSFANELHLEKHKFHPYVFEIAGMVRSGVMPREDGLNKFSIVENFKTINYVKTKLGIR